MDNHESRQRQKHLGEPSNQGSVRRGALIFVLVTSFLNLMGISIIAPVSPYIAEHYGAGPFLIGLLFSANSLFQFLAMPGLGALSDHFGRRPILLLSLLGSAIGYLMFGIGGALWVLFASRILDGVTSGDLGAILAYIADITDPEDRVKYYGWIGAVSGFGFVVGPAIGGLLSRMSYEAPFYATAVITFANVVWGYFQLPESLPKEKRTDSVTVGHLNPFSQLWDALRILEIRWLLLAIFLVAIAFAMLQANLTVLIQDTLHWTPDGTSSVFFVVGTVGIITQGLLIPRLKTKFGESRLALTGTLLQATGFILVSIFAGVASSLLLYASATVFALGNGLVNPSLTALLSNTVGPSHQGKLQGSSQSLQALGRVLGPLWGGFFYEKLSRASPYWSGAAIFILATITISFALPHLKKPQGTPKVPKQSVAAAGD